MTLKTFNTFYSEEKDMIDKMLIPDGFEYIYECGVTQGRNNPYIIPSKNPDLGLTIRWFEKAYAAIYAAKGDPKKMINEIPKNLLDNMIRNNIYLTYEKKE